MTGALQNKVALITGGGNGLGAAIAAAYDREGATVVVSDLDTENAARIAKGLVRGSSAVCDVTDEVAVQQLFHDVVTQHGRVDVVVANAGVVRPSTLADMDLAEWRRTTSVNLDGPFLTVRAGALAMAATGGGSIIAIASIGALKGFAFLASHGAAGAGVINLCKTAASEFRSDSIRVNAICPAFVDTVGLREALPSFEKVMGSSFEEILTHKQGRMGQASDIAPLAVFLGSERSRFSTGSVFVVDNGWTASLA